MSAYVSIRRHTPNPNSTSLRPSTPPAPRSAYVRIRPHTSAYVSIRQRRTPGITCAAAR
jgi:hypothetical protein